MKKALFNSDLSYVYVCTALVFSFIIKTACPHRRYTRFTLYKSMGNYLPLDSDN